MKLTRKRLRQTFSLVGATIILATFIAKDVRTDKLKELGNAIDVAQNTFNIEYDERLTYAEIKTLEDRLDAFVANGGKPLTAHPDPFRLDGPFLRPNCDSLDAIAMTHSVNQGSFVRVARLAKKLPDDIRIQLKVDDMSTRLDSAELLIEQMQFECETAAFKLAPPPTSEEFRDAADTVMQLGLESQKLSSHLITTAAQEHDRAEENAKHWSIVYYVLYAIGWIVSVAGILIGEPDEKSVVEKLAES
jgi:hypothetical protein